jgi:ABC-2 type transport system permease protein
MVANQTTPNGNSRMILETDAGWTRGLKNVLRGELLSWFGTRMWWVQILIWAASVNLVYLMVAFTARNQLDFESIMIFNIFMGIAGPIGVSIVMQNEVVGEKRSGTAAWIMSKPVSRLSFILAKLIANSVGIAITMVLAQGLIAYFITVLVLQTVLPVPGFLAGLGVHMINIFFYLSLTLMLGTLFSHPAPVIGIPLAFLFSQNFLSSFYPPLFKVLPWILAVPVNNSSDPSIAMAMMTGGQVPSLLPVFTTLTASILFIVLALWIFQRQEL